ncbi:HOG (high osmolarity glycerol) pathway protein [Arachnomyces sp. PD_36]|nr:HOG (high osmolarity glycerol) pathway protein [Arachnomyces sp. PD_36]
MATVMTSSTSQHDSPTSNPTVTTLPPLITSPSSKGSSLQRPISYAKNRMSSYSNASFAGKSRPVSHVFPAFHSSLPYALVRDFAYPPIHPLHYGPPPHTSGLSTPISESRPLSDPPSSFWDSSREQWSGDSDVYGGHQQLPAMAFGDGPPYSEDEDLHSPVVTTSRHRKHRSGEGRRGRSPGDRSRADNNGLLSPSSIDGRGAFLGVNGDGSETYYIRDDDAADDGPGGEFVTYPANESRHLLSPGSFNPSGRRDSHFAASIRAQGGVDLEIGPDSDDDISDADSRRDQSRFSRDYQFTIASPDEEMHGKAVALFDFEREHENELPLQEGQVVLVSYRHGQGWLVAEDPKTGESGLVPEEFVRLFRHIEGGLNGLDGDLSYSPAEPNPSLGQVLSGQPDSATPTQPDQLLPNSSTAATNSSHSAHSSNGSGSNSSGEKHPPIVSTFSTSSRDLDLYPQHLLSPGQVKSGPPQIEHYDEKKFGIDNVNGKHASMPILSSPLKDSENSTKT